MSNAPLSNHWNLYGEVFRQHAHQLLAWAYTDARPLFHPGLTEPDMTGLLAQAMKLRLNTHTDTPEAFDHYWIGDQEPHSPSGELGNDRLRLDITVIRNGVRPRLTFVFEAKRLRTNGYPISKYVGEGGMGDFISGRYAAEAPEAAMVALFENQSPDYWHSELWRSFVEDSKMECPRLAVIGLLSATPILPELPHELESSHRREGNTPIRLFHIFLDCTPATNTNLA